jgi:hypothetical protein
MTTAKKKPRRMKAYESFSEWKKDQSTRNKKLIGELARLVKKEAPQFTATVKWGQGCWVSGNVPKIYIHAEDDHVQFGFYSGASLNDPEKLLVGSGKYVRHIKVRTAKDIDPAAFADLISQLTK